MHSLSNTDRSESSSDESWETGSVKPYFESPNSFKDLINKANTVPLIDIFQYYKISISNLNRIINCPFGKRHKDGRDKTPSFEYYPKTNTFYCHGCKITNLPCNFVAEAEGISVFKAAQRILNLYASQVDLSVLENYSSMDFSKHLEILMSFSDLVREFIQSNSNNQEAIKFIEDKTLVFDSLYANHKKKGKPLNNEALLLLVDKFKVIINNFKI